jgi:hypothetical protein
MCCGRIKLKQTDMKKFMKPLAVLFLVAASTGAYAQQDKPARPIKAQLKMKEVPAKQMQQNHKKVKALLVPNREADIKKMVRRKGLTVAQVK